MLEEYDKKIMDNRDTKKFRHKWKETTTVKKLKQDSRIYKSKIYAKTRRWKK